MGVLDFLKGNSAEGMIEGLGGAASKIIDKVVTNQGEKGALKNQFTDLITSFQMAYQQEITKRHEADMKSDSWLAKNVRPLTLIYLIAVVSVLAFTDGNVGGELIEGEYVGGFSIRPEYITLFTGLLTLVFSFYFGSRGIEKVMETVGKYKLQRERRRKD